MKFIRFYFLSMISYFRFVLFSAAAILIFRAELAILLGKLIFLGGWARGYLQVNITSAISH